MAQHPPQTRKCSTRPKLNRPGVDIFWPGPPESRGWPRPRAWRGTHRHRTVRSSHRRCRAGCTRLVDGGAVMLDCHPLLSTIIQHSDYLYNTERLPRVITVSPSLVYAPEADNAGSVANARLPGGWRPWSGGGVRQQAAGAGRAAESNARLVQGSRPGSWRRPWSIHISAIRS